MHNTEQFKKVETYYNQSYYGQLHPSDTPALAKHYRLIADRLGSLKGLEVLDVACGTGEWLGLLQELGAKPAGIDISRRAINVCRRRFGKKNFRVGRAEKLPYPSKKFDLVTCLGSIEHFVDPLQALNEMRRVAKPDARFLFLVPNDGFLLNRIGLYEGTDQAKIREDVRSYAGWKQLFKSANLGVEKSWRDLHIFNRHWVLQNGLVRAPQRLGVILLLLMLPLRWQYQVYFMASVVQNE